jgi:hypothetical protein
MRLFHFFLRDKMKFPGVCIAALIEGEHPILHFAIAVHNPIDIYSKDEAIRLAVSRLESNPVCIGSLVDDRAMTAQNAIAHYLASNGRTQPRQAVDNSRRWLKDVRHDPNHRKNNEAKEAK